MNTKKGKNKSLYYKDDCEILSLQFFKKKPAFPKKKCRHGKIIVINTNHQNLIG